MTTDTPAERPLQVRDPIDRVRWLATGEILPNLWNPNRVMRPELRLLERSILLTGWVHPLIVVPRGEGGYLIVDGYHRWRLAVESPALNQKYGGLLPCVVLDLDVEEAMLLTVRINRAKGSHGSVAMSVLVRALLARGVPIDRICEDMGASPAEVDLLAQENVLKARKADTWTYSPAWHPVETGEKPSQVAARRRAEKDERDTVAPCEDTTCHRDCQGTWPAGHAYHVRGCPNDPSHSGESGSVTPRVRPH